MRYCAVFVKSGYGAVYKEHSMNRIVYIVGLVVVVLIVLSFLGMR